MATFEHGHAVVVGVGADLPCTVKDAQGLAALLRDEERCGYPYDQVVELTEDGARRKDVLAALSHVASTAEAGATVVVFFSGHGVRVGEPPTDRYYLCPYGTDVTLWEESTISGDELRAALSAIRSARLLMLLDCCHAGGLERVKAAKPALAKAPLPLDAVAALRKGRGRAVIASSRANEYSYPGTPYSAFTAAVIESLSGVGIDREDGLVRVTDLALHAREFVPTWTDGRQHPVLDYDEADNFAIAYYAAGDEQVKAPPFIGPPAITLEHVPDAPPSAPLPRHEYNAGAVRRFLVDALVEGEIEDLCLERDFRPAFELLSSGMGKSDKVRRVVEWSMRQELLPDLVNAVRERNPAAYRRHREQLSD